MKMSLPFASFTIFFTENVWELIAAPPESLPTRQNGVKTVIRSIFPALSGPAYGRSAGLIPETAAGNRAKKRDGGRNCKSICRRLFVLAERSRTYFLILFNNEGTPWDWPGSAVADPGSPDHPSTPSTLPPPPIIMITFLLLLWN